MLNVIRSGIFGVLFYLVTPVVAIIFAPVLLYSVITKKEIPLFVPHVWSRIIIFLAKYVLGISYKIQGKEHLSGKFIVACKHQSAWETIIFFLVLQKPSYIYRHEINSIPFFGSYISRLGQIAVKRGKGKVAVEKLEKDTAKLVQQGRVPVIFPEGTRVPVEVGKKKYKSGIYYIAKANNINVVPATLNSGYCWPRNKFWGKKAGVITLKFLPAIKAEGSKQDFLNKLENVIETAREQL